MGAASLLITCLSACADLTDGDSSGSSSPHGDLRAESAEYGGETTDGGATTDGAAIIDGGATTDGVATIGGGVTTDGGASLDAGGQVTPSGPARSMGFIGCSMAENVAQGYNAVGGVRMWPPYGTGSLVVQSWTSTNSSAWRKFDQQAQRFGKPSAVWVQVCMFSFAGATYEEVKKMIANARAHAAAGATIYVSGQPLYPAGQVCTLSGPGGPELTDELAKRAAADPTQNVTYAGAFGPLGPTMVADPCHANTEGQRLLGEQAVRVFGK